MDMHDLTRELQLSNDSKIVMLVADGLGGLPMQAGGKTELESALTPNLSALAKLGVQGASIPVKPGIAPGSGPGHLGLFGYDPLQYQIGRGALEATGIGFALQDGDVAIRCNFCSLDAQGKIKIPGIEVFVEPVKEHRFVVVFRGAGLGGNVADTDPQKTGVPPLDPVAQDEASKKTAEVAKEFLAQAKKILAGHPKANFHTMRGFASKPALPSYQEVYGLKAAAIAAGQPDWGNGGWCFG